MAYRVTTYQTGFIKTQTQSDKWAKLMLQPVTHSIGVTITDK